MSIFPPIKETGRGRSRAQLIKQHIAASQIEGLEGASASDLLPTPDEKAALAGTTGAPGGGNKYATNADPRLSDARTPTVHAASHLNGGADELADRLDPRALRLAVASKTGAYTATDEDTLIRCDASAGAFAISLPSAAGRTGKQFVVKKVDSSANAVTVDPNGSETIDGAATYDLATQWKFIDVISDGSNWLIVGTN